MFSGQQKRADIKSAPKEYYQLCTVQPLEQQQQREAGQSQDTDDGGVDPIEPQSQWQVQPAAELVEDQQADKPQRRVDQQFEKPAYRRAEQLEGRQYDNDANPADQKQLACGHVPSPSF